MGFEMSPASAEKKYKIGEVCKKADVQPYVLRYWETEFPSLAPNKSGGGQRTYTESDVQIITRIKALLYTEGFTIAGAKKKLDAELREDGSVNPPAPEPTPTTTPGKPSPKIGKAIKAASKELREVLELLD